MAKQYDPTLDITHKEFKPIIADAEFSYGFKIADYDGENMKVRVNKLQQTVNRGVINAKFNGFPPDVKIIGEVVKKFQEIETFLKTKEGKKLIK